MLDICAWLCIYIFVRYWYVVLDYVLDCEYNNFGVLFGYVYKFYIDKNNYKCR